MIGEYEKGGREIQEGGLSERREK
jgi:hypothetical protein